MSVRLTLEARSEPHEPKLVCKCSEIIIKAQGDVQKLRAKVLIIKGDSVYAICKKCNSEVPVPLEKSASDAPFDPGPHLYLEK